MTRNGRPRPVAAARPSITVEATAQAEALYRKARTAAGQGQDVEAIRQLTEAIRLEPIHAEALALQAQLLEKHGGDLNVAIQALQTALYQLPERADLYFLLSKWLAKKGDMRGAASAMKRCVELRPNHSAPRHQLAALYGSLGYEAQSRYCATRALKIKSVTVREARQDCRLTVLVLNTATSGALRVNRNTFATSIGEGHNNLAGLLDAEHISVIRVYVDVLARNPRLIRELPRADLVYNGITDPERCAEALEQAQLICDHLGLPVINPPRAVLAASREGNYARFRDNPQIILPRSLKLEGVQGSCREIVERAIGEQGFQLPLIVRLAGFQGGKYMHKVDDLTRHDFSELDAELAKEPQTLYLIQYHDVSYRDERAADSVLYPKYRAFLVGGQLYPCHLFTAGDFNVHKKNADPLMNAHPWLVEHERHYCQSPAGHLGAQQWQALEQLMREVGLDYCGVDFAPARAAGEAGKLVIFEINPAMRNWVDQLPEGDHVQQAWHRITAATHQDLARQAEVEAWEFVLPRGKVAVVEQV